jgi:hypothetical protein
MLTSVSRRSTFQKKVSFLGASSDSKDEGEIGLAEWTRNNKLVSCPFAKKDAEKYRFDITKADMICDLLLQEGQIKLSRNYMIPSVEELKNCKYCKWHNTMSHNTNECKTFHQQIQSAIEQGRIKFKNPSKLMKIDGHPFPSANMVEINDLGNVGVLPPSPPRDTPEVVSCR